MFKFLFPIKSSTRLLNLTLIFTLGAGWIFLTVLSAKELNQNAPTSNKNDRKFENASTFSALRSFDQPAAESVRQISLKTNDIIYHPEDQMLYVSVPGSSGSIGNSITRIDPRTGEIGSSTFIGSEPNRLALAGDNQTMYVSLDGAFAVRQFNTATQMPGPQQYRTGNDSSYHPYQIHDLVVPQNIPGLFAFTRSALQTTANIAIYKDGVQSPQNVPRLEFHSLAFSTSGTMLFGLQNYMQLTRMSVDAAGKVSVNGTTSILSSTSKIRYADGLIFTSRGEVINADTGIVIGTFPNVFSSVFVPDATVGRVYYAVKDHNTGNIIINAYDIATFSLAGSLTIPDVPGVPESLVRWGANGLAFRTQNNRLVVVQTSLIPSQEPIPTLSPTPTLTPTPTPTPSIAFTRQISLPINDFIFHSATQKIYATIPSRAGGNIGNSVTAIDPVGGTIDSSIFVGSEPGKIAAADDSTTAYVGLNGAGAVRQLDIASFTPVSLFSLGTINSGGYSPMDIAVKPGAPNTLAVLRRSNDVGIYEDGVLSVQTNNPFSLTSLVFGSANALYANSLSRTFKYSVAPTGLSQADVFSGSSDGQLYFENGLIYMPTGMVIDAETGAIKGTFSGLRSPNAMVIDSSANRAFFLNQRSDGTLGFALLAYELDTFRFVGSLNIEGSFSNSAPPVMARWGINGIAYSDHNDKLFLVQSSLINSAGQVPAPTPTVTPTPTPSPAYIPTFIRKVNLPVRDVVYNEATQSLYASVPGTAGVERGNSITQILPLTGELGSSIPVGSEPSKLALADDNRTLYAKLDGTNAIRRVDVVGQTAGAQFTPEPAFQNFQSMAVLPGAPDSVALPGNSSGIAIYDNEVRRAKTGGSQTYSIQGVEFPSSGTVYGYGKLYNSYDLIKFSVNSEGVTATNTASNIFSGSDVDTAFGGGLLYSTSGRIIDAAAPRLVGTFNEGGTSMAIDTALNRVFYMTSNRLTAYDATTFLKIGSITFPNLNGVARRSLIRWGANGLALLTFTSQPASSVRDLYLIQSTLVSPSAPVPVGLQLNAANNVYENSSNATLTVTRTGDISSVISVNYATADGTAIAGSDYAATTGTLVFAAGESSKNIIVPLLNDNVYENNETFTLTLSNPGGGDVQILSGETIVTIINEDPKPALATSNIVVQEPRYGTIEAVFTVRLTNLTSQTVSANYSTLNGTATPGFDYISTSGTLTFAPMEMTKTITVKINADALSESNETFFLSLSGITNAVNTTTQASATIQNTARRQAFDFDGDGRADVSVFRPADGVWYLNRSGQGFTASQFGLSTDKIAPADYDGDGKTDIAVFREGTWYLLKSSQGFSAIQFGAAGDVPQSADFDGDGRAELAVFRSSDGGWYVLNLANSQTGGAPFGSDGDIPVVGDYDGDDKADQAVFRPSDATWYLLGSSQGFSAIQFGIHSDKPVPADYDGDGKVDPAVYREGVWYLLRSSQGFTGIQFGLATDIPAPADYDGDGRADIAVFRSGSWYLLQNNNVFTGIQFGQAGDRPVTNAYIF